MSILKQTIEFSVKAFNIKGIDYITTQTVLSAIKDDSSVNDLLFHALFELILQQFFDFQALEAKEAWSKFKFTLPDYVYFMESTLCQSGYPLFLSKHCIKSLKITDMLSPKALLSAIYFIFLKFGIFEKVIQELDDSPNKFDETLDIQVEDKTYFQSIQTLQYLAQKQQLLIQQCSELAKTTNVILDANTPVQVQMDFFAKLSLKLILQLFEEQKQRRELENYQLQKEEFKFFNQIQDKQNEQIECEGDNEIQELNGMLKEIQEWASEEFWLDIK
ncbi:Conserved_hypothetical protein [Hexamita inflata]|uniref:Uncharacterized protein n=1 Tax=Hexamita inflata TaxID=28002 RepID=A0AA86R8K8_9EUKA|nr:Conserved hypothetical protein [Hexamita inflata]